MSEPHCRGIGGGHKGENHIFVVGVRLREAKQPPAKVEIHRSQPAVNVR